MSEETKRWEDMTLIEKVKEAVETSSKSDDAREAFDALDMLKDLSAEMARALIAADELTTTARNVLNHRDSKSFEALRLALAAYRAATGEQS